MFKHILRKYPCRSLYA